MLYVDGLILFALMMLAALKGGAAMAYGDKQEAACWLVAWGVTRMNFWNNQDRIQRQRDQSGEAA